MSQPLIVELRQVSLAIIERDGEVEIQARFGVKIRAKRMARNSVVLHLGDHTPIATEPGYRSEAYGQPR